MIESVMFMAIGSLLGASAALPFVSLVHDRAVRLTRRRLEPDLIRSNDEIRLHKDFARAEFAMAARRHELALEQLKQKMTRQLVDLGPQSDTINRLRIERETLRAEIAALKSEREVAQQAAAPADQAGDNVITFVRRLLPHRHSAELRTGRQAS